ncbi:MAG TPA: hypothetical protein VGO43_03300 [Pyrinomonadaceae bacterium]|nr:hypothetical protein [Pyrinomonadaceae bacterium]
MEAAQIEITLDQLPVGSRLIVRSKKDWRFASVSKVVEARVVLTVCSPSGHTYRLRRGLDTAVVRDGILYILPYDCDDTWRENFTRYDARW